MIEPSAGSSRRTFLGTAAGAAVVAGALAAQTGTAAAATPTPAAALRRLLAGNERYRRGRWTRRDYSPVAEERASAQAPFAAIVTCADSRLSPPLLFDVERGNLFASHVAGNGVDTGTLGSTEYAVAVLGVPLVMVLGHSDCGAIKAALGVAAGTASFPPETSGSIGAVVDGLVPAVRGIPAGPNQLRRSVAANARFQAATLRASKPILAPAVASGKLRVVAAVYDIGTGRVRLV